MKLSKELKVGLMAVAAIIGLILGFRFLKGKDVFNRTPKLYATFKSVGGLEKSNFVKINGLTIGSVYHMEPADENLSAIKVTLSITEDINVPSNSVAYISGSLLGASTVIIEKGDAKTYLRNGDTLQTKTEEGLLGNLTSEAKPLMGKVSTAADSLTLLLAHINNVLDANTQSNLRQAIANLSNTVASLNGLVVGMSKPLSSSLDNINSFTTNLKNNNSQIEGILSNANTFTNSLNQLRLQSTLDTLNTTIAELKSAVAKLSNPNGSLGALMNDRKLYNRINDVALSAEILLDDIRVNPRRYVNISVFGKKNKAGELTAPSIKDSIPR